MSGRYTFFVAAGVPSVKLSICNIAVFGTRYIRATDPPSSITLDTCSKTLTVSHVYAEDVIADTLEINLKQKTGFELSWVNIINSSRSADVKINAIGVPPGTYSLVLESVDTISALSDLALKTDIVTI
jgi:hypothetical protein